MKKTILIGAAIFIIFTAPSVFADSANIGGYGNTVTITESNEIQMLREFINIDIYDEDKYAEGYGWVRNGYAEIEVLYTFKNLTDEEVTVEMGFPEECSYCYLEEEDYEPWGDELYDFYKLVDFQAFEWDDEIPVTFRTDTEAETEGTNWYLYEVTFDPNEEKQITNTYWISPMTYKGSVGYEYIMETGASWKNDIEDISIYVNLHGDLSTYDLLEISPDGYYLDEEENGVQWHISNLEPTDDDNIYIRYFDRSFGDFICKLAPEESEGFASSSLLPEGDLSYYPCRGYDYDTSTAWVEGVDGSGIGEWLEYDFPYLYQDKTFEKIRIFNGYGESEDLWEKNNRVKKAELSFSNGQKQILNLKDTYGYQVIDLDEPITNPETATLEILEVYQGTTYDDTAITEIEFLGIIDEQNNVFPDIDGHLYEYAIGFIKAREIVSGYPDGTYKPDNTINRAELTKIIIEAAYPGEATGTDCFPDVSDEWFAKYVCFAKNNNIIDGYPDGTFRPGNDINYVEALKITLGAFNYGIPSATDPWYQGYVDLAEAMKVTVADTEIGEILTRAKMAELITRIIKYKEEGIESSYLN